MKTRSVTVTWDETGTFTISSENINSMEVLGLLRYAEKEVFAGLHTYSEKTKSDIESPVRQTIADFINTKNASIRLIGALHHYAETYLKNFIDEVDKSRFLKLRNAGINTWKEFEKLKLQTA